MNLKKVMTCAACGAAIAVLSSCYSITTPVCATSNTVGNKCGESVYKTGLFSSPRNADVGINTAAKNGGITKISHVDQNIKKFGIFGMRKKVTTRVYGE